MNIPWNKKLSEVIKDTQESGLTTSRNDPKLGYGVDTKPVPQNEKYLVLSEEERAKGFVRPVRDTYIHVGKLTELETDDGVPSHTVRVGGCGRKTTMGRAIAETYAREPKFYGSTYCTHCRMHLPVAEFNWEGTDEVVGS